MTAQMNSGSTRPRSSAVQSGGVHGEATTSRPSTAPANTPSASSRPRPQTKQLPNIPSGAPRYRPAGSPAAPAPSPDEAVPEHPMGSPPVPAGRVASLTGAHRVRRLRVELGRLAGLGDEGLALEDPHDPIVADDVERSLERDGTPQCHLRRPLDEVADHRRAVP